MECQSRNATGFGFAGALRWGLACFSVLVPSTGQAADEGPQPGSDAPITVHFDYTAPPDCLEADEAYDLVHLRSGRIRRARDADEASQELEMNIEVDGSRYRGTLTVTRPGQAAEHRAMAGVHCDEVVEALALTAALSIDPNATLTLGPARPRSVPTSGAPQGAAPGNEEGSLARDEPTKVVTIASRPGGRRSARDLRVTFGFDGDVQKVMTHTLHVGGGLSFSVSDDEVTILLPLEFSFGAQFLTETAPSDTELFSRLLLADVAYCPMRLGREIAFLICPTAQLGALWVEARGLEDQQDVTRFVANLGGEARGRVRWGSTFEATLSAALRGSLTDRSFEVTEPREEISSTAALGWSASARLGWAF